VAAKETWGYNIVSIT